MPLSIPLGILNTDIVLQQNVNIFIDCTVYLINTIKWIIELATHSIFLAKVMHIQKYEICCYRVIHVYVAILHGDISTERTILVNTI